MTLVQHAKLTAIAALFLLPFWSGMQILLFSIGSIFIDIDHYIFYVFRCRRLSIKGMFEYHEKLFEQKDRIPYAGICIFHTIDFFIIIGILSFYYHIFLYLLIGLLFHFVVDLIYLYRNNYLLGRAYFFIEHFIRKKRHAGYPYF